MSYLLDYYSIEPAFFFVVRSVLQRYRVFHSTDPGAFSGGCCHHCECSCATTDVFYSIICRHCDAVIERSIYEHIHPCIFYLGYLNMFDSEQKTNVRIHLLCVTLEQHALGLQPTVGMK